MPSPAEIKAARKKAEESGILKYSKQIKEIADQPDYAGGRGPSAEQKATMSAAEKAAKMKKRGK